MTIETEIKRQIRKQGNVTDDWLDRYVIQRYMPVSSALERQAKVTTNAMRSARDFITYNGMRKLYDVQSLGLAATSQISMIANEAAGHLQRDTERIHGMGVDAAVEQALMQLPELDRGRRTKFRDVSRQKVLPDSRLLQNVMGALPIKANRLGPMVGEMLEHKLADAMTLSRGKVSAKKIDGIVEDCLGTGLAFLIGMFGLALWSLYTGGIFRFLEIHSDWTNGWIWFATLDTKTCPSCIALHGQHFTRDDIFRDHPHGRCEPIVVVDRLPWWWTGAMIEFGLGADDDDYVKPIEIEELGEDWFARLTAEEREAILGHAAYRAYDAGAISLEDLSGTHNHDVYGQIRLTASLKSILGDKATDYYGH